MRNISPLTAIEKFSGARNGKIRADCYDDCQDIANPSALNPMQKNLLLLDDCVLGKENKALVDTGGIDINALIDGAGIVLD